LERFIKEGLMDFHSRKITEISIRIDSKNIVLIPKGGTAIEMPWDAALILGKAIIHQAHKAEEIAKAEKVIGDGAFLIRSGAPFGISDNPDILKEATKEAQYNDELRKMMPSGVKSTTIFGAPTIIQHKPRRNGNGNKL